MGRIHRYGQRHDCLIFNFVATNTIEGRVLQRLLDKLQEIRNALDDDTVFNVVGEVLPSAHVERVLRDYYAGALGEADLEERLLRNVDEGHFRAICQTALEGLAAKRLNLDMLIERRARAQERRVVPETIARFIKECARNASLTLKPVSHMVHTFEPGRTPSGLKKYEREPGWKLPDRIRDVRRVAKLLRDGGYSYESLVFAFPIVPRNYTRHDAANNLDPALERPLISLSGPSAKSATNLPAMDSWTLCTHEP